MKKFKIVVPIEESTSMYQCFVNVVGQESFPIIVKNTASTATCNLIPSDEQQTILMLVLPGVEITEIYN